MIEHRFESAWWASLLGQRWSATLTDQSLSIQMSEGVTLLPDIGKIQIAELPGVLGRSIRLFHPDLASPLNLHGMPRKVAQTSAETIRQIRNRQLGREVENHLATLNNALAALTRGTTGIGQYLTNGRLQSLKQSVLSSAADALVAADELLSRPDQQELVALDELKKIRGRLVARIDNLNLVAQSWNEEFLSSERERWSDFFAALESKGLTEEQATAAMIMEENSLLEAGAGSGKTSVIVGRVGYAIKSGVCNPDEVICVAFNKDAATEIKDRIKSRLDRPELGLHGVEGVTGATFHSLGLKIVRSATDPKQPLRILADDARPADLMDASANVALSREKSERMALLSETVAELYRTSWGESCESFRLMLAKRDRSAGEGEGAGPGSLNLVTLKALAAAESAFYTSPQNIDRPLSELEERLAAQGLLWGLHSSEIQALSGFPRMIKTLSGAFRARMEAAGYLDFDGMIMRAIEVLQKVKSGELASLRSKDPFKRRFILVDEFQDISYARAVMVRLLREIHGDQGHLFGVGDDWQAINRFAGSDMTLFTRFEEFFGATDRRQLTRTFRSNRGIAETARQFVIRNAEQSKKAVEGVADERRTDIIRALQYRDLDGAIEQIRSQIQAWVDKHNGTPSVFILDRNRLQNSRLFRASPAAVDALRREFAGRAKIDAQTAHGSKGLEADYVIVTGLSQGGFPNMTPPDFWTELFLPPADSGIEAPDERRLFYVALTRARHEVALLVPESGQSPFVAETLAIAQRVSNERANA